MAGLYVDTSALGRVLLAEPDAGVIRSTIGGYQEQWSSELVVVELGRLAKLHGLQTASEQLLTNIQLLRLTRPRLRAAAGIDPAQVRTLDSIHLSAAVALRRMGTISAVLTYDGPASGGLPAPGHRRRSSGLKSLPVEEL